MNAIANILVKFRLHLFLLTLGLCTLTIALFPAPAFNGKLSGFDVENSSEFKEFEKTNSLFGGNSKVFLQIIPSTDNRKTIQEYVEEVRTKINKKYPKAVVSAPTDYYSKMIRHWKVKNNSLSDFLNEAKDVPVLQLLVAKDKKSFLIVTSFKGEATFEPAFFDKIGKQKDSRIEAVHVLSAAHLNASIESHIKSDFGLLMTIILAFFVLYILAVFRDFKVLIYSAIMILIPIALSLVLFSVWSMEINLISILVIPIVLILALSDALHLLTGYIKMDVQIPKEERIKEIVRRYMVPSFFSSATTAAAFFSFYLFNDSRNIQEFGLITAIALMLEFVLAFAIAPFVLFWLNPSRIRDRQLNKFSGFLETNKRVVSFGLIGILFVSVFFLDKLSIQSDTEVFFPEKSEIKTAHQAFRKNFYSSITLNIVIRGNRALDGQDDPVYAYTKLCADKIRQSKKVASIVSATDQFYFKSKMGVPVNLFSTLGEANPYYNAKKNAYRIELNFSEANDIVQFVEKDLKRILPDTPKGVVVSHSSQALLMDELNESISVSLIESLSTSGIFIFFMILLLTRSISASLLSLIPNLVPIGFVVILYYILGMHINMITALTAVISLGLLDDDTVHILYRKLWLKEPLQELSFSILSSAIILVICFSFFLVSSFDPIEVFGWVSALIFVVGILCEMTLMQWIIELILKRKRIEA